MNNTNELENVTFDENYVLTVMNEDGKSFNIEVLNIVNIEGSDKEYVIYILENDVVDNEGNQNIYASILDETNDTVTLKTIENNDEWNKIQEIINQMFAEN